MKWRVTRPLDSLRNHLEIWPWKTACESLKQQQDSCQRLAKHKPEKVPNVTFGIHKKQVSSPPSGLGKTACESLKQQQDSCQRLAKHKPEKVPSATFGIHKKIKSLALRLALENRLRKPQTAAGFVPKACETQARKSAERHLWNP